MTTIIPKEISTGAIWASSSVSEHDAAMKIYGNRERGGSTIDRILGSIMASFLSLQNEGAEIFRARHITPPLHPIDTMDKLYFYLHSHSSLLSWASKAEQQIGSFLFFPEVKIVIEGWIEKLASLSSHGTEFIITSLTMQLRQWAEKDTPIHGDIALWAKSQRVGGHEDICPILKELVGIIRKELLDFRACV